MINESTYRLRTRENKTRNNLRMNNLNSGGNGSLRSEEEDQIKINTWKKMISDTI